MTITARVQAGRLVVDEPTTLPEGTEVELLLLRRLPALLAKHRDHKVTERLNAVYAGDESRLDAPLRRGHTRSISVDSSW